MLDRAVERFQGGVDRERSFRLVFERFHRPVASFFARRGVPPEERLDLTQETFLRVYRGLATYRSEEKLGSWILRIAANTHLKHLRAAGAEKRSGVELPVEPVMHGGAPQLATRGPQLDRLLTDERRRQIAGAVGELPAQQKQCVRLRVEQDLSYREIAVALRISVDTVKTHLRQARHRLRGRLGEALEEER